MSGPGPIKTSGPEGGGGPAGGVEGGDDVGFALLTGSAKGTLGVLNWTGVLLLVKVGGTAGVALGSRKAAGA